MVPRINPRGSSFKGITSYLLYGEDRTETPERVEWSQTGNMYTNDIEKASKVMAFTAMHAEDLKRENGGSLVGSKADGNPVYHNSLSWHVNDNPDEAHMKKTALDYIDKRGLSEHEYYIVAHNDTDHKHVHIVVNLVHPETGKTKELGLDKRASQEWALEYEREHGIQCELREENAAKRERGEYTKHQDQKQDYSEKITRAYYASDNGKSFIHALEAEGLHLAKARRGNNFVIVDEKGDIQKFARQLDIDEKGKAKTAAIQAKLADIERDKLLDADTLSKQIRQAQLDREKSIAQAQYYDRDAQEAEQQKKLAQAAHRAAEEKAIQDAQLLKERRLEILSLAKQDWAELRERQPTEKKALEEKLRAQDSPKEKIHREHWQSIIDKDEQHKAQLEENLNKSGVAGLWFRARHGKETREEIAALDKNLENSRMRLNEGIGGLTGGYRYQLMQLRKTHKEERAALQSRIDEELRIAGEQAKITDGHKDKNDNQIQGEHMARKRPGMSSLDNWELDGLYSVVENDPARDTRSNTVRRESPTPNVKHEFYKADNQQGESEAITAPEDTTTEEWEELQEIFAEQREEIENNPDYSDAEREQAIYDLEDEYSAIQVQHEQEMEQGRDYDQGIER